ncbi:MAG TPA: hypothetical protein PKW74_04370 [Ruminococcus bromii]|nr:hypothetical protein [Ruminococcus bromii]
MLSDVAAPPVAEVGFTEVVPTVAGSPVGAVGSSDAEISQQGWLKNL